MSNKSRSMNKVKIILQSIENGMTIKGVSRSHGVSKNTIKGYIKKIRDAKISMSKALELNDESLERLLYKTQDKETLNGDLDEVGIDYNKELSRPHVTKQLLFEEYKDKGGKHGRSMFYKELNKLEKGKGVTFTKREKAGERLEIDYSGKKLQYISEDGEVKECELLVTIVSGSLIYCEAQTSQKSENYINGLGRALKYIGYKPKEIVSDNLKSGIKRSDRYEPELTELCEEASKYYGVHITATRVAKPRDKPQVERSVRIVYERIYAKLRDRQLGSLDELNTLIWQALEELNDRQVNNKKSRREVFEQEVRGSMLPLTVTELMEVKKRRYGKVGKNYHIELTEDKHYYSVPYTYTGDEVKVIYSASIVEIYYKGTRIALHQRHKSGYKYHTMDEHMPPNHKAAKQVNGYTREDIISQASQIGDNTRRVVEDIIIRSTYESQAFKSALGVIHLAKKYGKERVERANEKLRYLYPTYSSIREYLSKNMDYIQINAVEEKIIPHDNLRHLKIVK